MIVFSDKHMHDLVLGEVGAGRFPKEIELHLAELPQELERAVVGARKLAADEVTPRLEK